MCEGCCELVSTAALCVCVAVQVTFMNAQGLSEAGLDHGGLMKELLEQVVALGTQPEYGLFATTEDTGLLYPNPTAEAIPQGLALLEFLGELKPHLHSMGYRKVRGTGCTLYQHRCLTEFKMQGTGFRVRVSGYRVLNRALHRIRDTGYSVQGSKTRTGF